MESADLEMLAAQVRRSLHWAGFLLMIMVVILVIDLQLKKAVARQATAASKIYTDLVMRYGGQAPAAAAGPAAGDDGDSGVGGTAGMAAADNPGPDAGTPAADGGMDGTPVRAPRDGRRTGGPR